MLIAEGRTEEIKVSVTENDLYNVNYTGGTTGVSKGVVRIHRTYVSSVMMELIEGEIRENETYLAVTPLTHAAGALLLPAFLRGGSCVILPGFNPAQFLQTVEQEKVTFSFMVPTMIYNLLDHPDVGKYDTSSLRTIIYGAAPMSPERLKEAIQIFGPIFTQYYAQVEAVMPVTLLRKQEHIVAGDAKGVARLSSCGRPSIAYRLKLVDEQGRDVPVGQPGEILVQGPSVMVGYLKRPELTAETLRDGWLHTGDIARMDEDGYIYIVDRKKDMIVSGGFNIYPKEVEDVLYEHPAVAMAAVIGVPHPKWGEEVKAVVVLKPGAAATAEQLIAFCKERKGSLISPKTVDFAERIPVTGLGKPDKKALKEPYWKGRDRSIA
jgi:acyl-CoA synthetase (AMP-forming)/AMP-acid ligase II